MTSPIAGADGNVEFLLHLVAAPGARPTAAVQAELDAAVEAATARRG
jgi:hypothetical protein